MAGRWSEEQCSQLIALVRAQPCLWHKRDSGYSNKALRQAAWERIELCMQTEGSESQSKFKSLRDEFARVIKGTRKGFHFAQHMSFLRDEIVPRTSGSRVRRTQLTANHNNAPRRDDSDEVSDGLAEDDATTIISDNIYSHCYLSMEDNTTQEDFGVPENSVKNENASSFAGPPPPPAAALSSTESTEWTAPSENFTITSEDYHFCNTILRTMNDLPKHKKRKLQVKIFKLVVDDVAEYEGSG